MASNSFEDHLDFQLALLKLNPALPKVVKPNDLGIAYRIADAKPAIHKKKQKETSDETVWAALGVAAGNFSQSASNLDLIQASSPKAGFNLQNSATSGKTEKGPSRPTWAVLTRQSKLSRPAPSGAAMMSASMPPPFFQGIRA